MWMLYQSKSPRRKASVTLMFVFADVSKNGHLYSAANASPCFVFMTLSSTKSHLVPIRIRLISSL